MLVERTTARHAAGPGGGTFSHAQPVAEQDRVKPIHKLHRALRERAQMLRTLELLVPAFGLFSGRVFGIVNEPLELFNCDLTVTEVIRSRQG